MYTKTALESIIKDVFIKTTGVEISTFENNLLSVSLRVPPATYLYFLDVLEKELQLPVFTLLETHTYEVMAISNLASALFNLQNEIAVLPNSQ
jgi:hypothetical protein